MISDSRYLAWQAKIAARKFFRRFWIFWAIYSVVFVFLAALHILFLGKLTVDLLALAAFILARAIVSPSIFFFYKKPRPYQKFNFTTIHSRLLSGVTTEANSFPSDHAASFASIATVFYIYFPWIGLALFAAAILNGIGRVIFGYHYWIDIVAGWAVGALSALLVVYLLGPIILK